MEVRLAIVRDTSAPDTVRLQAMRDIEDRALGRPTMVVGDVTPQEPDSLEAFRDMPLAEKLAPLARSWRHASRQPASQEPLPLACRANLQAACTGAWQRGRAAA